MGMRVNRKQNVLSVVGSLGAESTTEEEQQWRNHHPLLHLPLAAVVDVVWASSGKWSDGRAVINQERTRCY